MTTIYTPDVHLNCMAWATWITDSKRPLKQRASLCRSIKLHYDLAPQVEMLIQLKLTLERLRARKGAGTK